jgi:hypothetical protein
VRGTLFCAIHQNCKGSPLSGYEPAYNPDKYNKNPLIQATHNCWAYAADVLDPAQLTQCLNKPKGCQLLYHQPGGTQGHSNELAHAKARTCDVVEKLIREDVPDIQTTTFNARCPAGTSKIVLVVDDGDDYHFYRQDADGMWSHKDGANKVKRYDAEGLPIWNPLTAARDYRPRGSFLNYTKFCGFKCFPRNKTVRLARGGRRTQKQRRHRR